MITGRRLINKGWFALDFGAGNGPVIAAKGSRTLTQRIFFTGGLTMNFRSSGIFPGLVGSKYCVSAILCSHKLSKIILKS